MMPKKAKQASPVKPKWSDDPALSEAQKQEILALKDRLSQRNRFKLQENKKTGGLEPSDENAALIQLKAMEATGMIDLDASSKLLSQVISAQSNPENLSNANAAIALLHGIAPQDELEGMLAAQMVAVHNLSLEYARRAMGQNLNLDVSNSLINRATKLMNVFTRQVETLQKYRNKGQQKITVQHVQVGQGGQAIIGDVHQGGKG